MGSTRLPGKVLIDIEGKPLLEHVIQRVSASKLIQRIIIVTTKNKKDKAIISFSRQREISCFAGSEEDVLDRFYKAAGRYNVDIIVRITPDDPFKDPEIIDKVIGYYLSHEEEVDYVSNTMKPTYPEGLDAEVFSFVALEKAWREAKKASEREHVTPYIWNHPELFRLANVENQEDLSHFRWTLDTEADLKFTREIYARLFKGQVFLMKDMLALLNTEPELQPINIKTSRNAGYLKSLEEEQTI